MIDILQFDEYLFHLINGEWTNSFFDSVLPLWRNKYTWTPLYLFIFSFLLINLKTKGLWIVLFAGLTIVVSDLTSSKVIKPTVQRVRPCNDIELEPKARTLIRCGGGYSFTSSHATNHFALATFLIGTLGVLFNWIKIPLLLWAFSVSYAQVYVGVHYPLDIFFGGLLGVLIGNLLVIVHSWTAMRVLPKNRA